MRNILFGLILVPLFAFGQTTIEMDPDSVETLMLHEVVIEGATQYVTSNKTTYLPDRNAKRSAQNASDLLNMMAIPQIVVSPVSGSVETNSGKEVAVYIDYEKASQTEKDALNAEDVKRVEYLTFPTDPRFGNDHYVINIILNHYDYGGYAKLTGIGNFMGGSGSGQAYLKTSYKSMTYDVNFYDKYADRGHTGQEQTQLFRFPTTEGGITEITRKTTLDDSRFQQNYIWSSFRAKYTAENMTISSTLGISADHQPHSDYSGRVVFSYPEFRTVESPFSNLEDIRSLSPYLQGSYYFDMGKEWLLNAYLYMNYNRNKNNIYYKSDETDIITKAAEKSFYSELNITLTKTINEKHTVGAYIFGAYVYDKVNYTGNTIASPLFHQYALTAVPTYNFNTERWSLSAMAGVIAESNKISGVRTNSVIPLLDFEGTYTPNDKNQFEAGISYSIKGVEMSDKTPDVLQVNELLYQTGNPKLKNSQFLTASAEYTFLPSNKFAISATAQWYRLLHFTSPLFTPEGPDGLMLRTIEDGGKYDFLKIGASLSLKLFNRSLVLKARPYLVYEKLKGVYNEHTFYPSLSVEASYYWKNWYATAFYSVAQKQLEQNNMNAIMSQGKDYYSLKIGWSNGDWNVSATAYNIFRRNWLEQTTWIKSRWFDQTNRIYSANYHQIVSVVVSYTFNFGKKIQQGDELQNSGGGSSAIMR